MKRSVMVVLSLLFILTACISEPRIDASSDEAMRRSIAKVRAALPEEQKKDFDEAITTLAMKYISFEDMMAGSVGAATADARIKEFLHGKTGPEVIALAEPIIKQNAAREKEQGEWQKKLEELKRQMEKSQQATQKELEELKKTREKSGS